MTLFSFLASLLGGQRSSSPRSSREGPTTQGGPPFIEGIDSPPMFSPTDPASAAARTTRSRKSKRQAAHAPETSQPTISKRTRKGQIEPGPSEKASQVPTKQPVRREGKRQKKAPPKRQGASGAPTADPSTKLDPTAW
eukprot:CAMPEP_0206147568 /NCGR_PEP_ID=MMETSP1473-20131121/33809_1 /ASSEMBLY_ACC=CAM_ASM_001109 /TAXON_ID=1461547 /ORGANISM="Stichococcus sp, Strain RCC1054" /LENGTH=137 /DNA_ID=CAMNT_0053544541 /DNA_START=6 /DNA_END=416 /DNA_ORIENTATION=+